PRFILHPPFESGRRRSRRARRPTTGHLGKVSHQGATEPPRSICLRMPYWLYRSTDQWGTWPVLRDRPLLLPPNPLTRVEYAGSYSSLEDAWAELERLLAHVP